MDFPAITLARPSHVIFCLSMTQNVKSNSSTDRRLQQPRLNMGDGCKLEKLSIPDEWTTFRAV
jgi:hypothetical protein